MMETWVERWEKAWGVAPRLSHFFSSQEARTVLREFKSCANTEGDVEVLAFLLIFSVWPEQAWKRRPSPQTLKKAARSFEECSRTIAKLANTGLLESPKVVQQIRDQLQQWATYLRGQERGLPMTPGGELWIGAAAPAGKRHRAKRQVVFFLTYYFHTLGCPVTPWRIITQFLILAKLAPSTARDQRIATWWSNLVRREDRRGGVEPFAPYQEDQLRLFKHLKDQVWPTSQ